VALKFEALLKQGVSEIHLPEPLVKMVPRILTKVTVGEMVKSTPETFDEALVFDRRWKISRVPIRRILTRPIHEKLQG
jgi:hypothetical protein